MDINLIRSLTTLVSFLIFIGIFVWAWSAARRPGFEAAARLPFEDGDAVAGPAAGDKA